MFKLKVSAHTFWAFHSRQTIPTTTHTTSHSRKPSAIKYLVYYYIWYYGVDPVRILYLQTFQISGDKAEPLSRSPLRDNGIFAKRTHTHTQVVITRAQLEPTQMAYDDAVYVRRALCAKCVMCVCLCVLCPKLNSFTVEASRRRGGGSGANENNTKP